jgi:hypothetical protein
MTADSERRLLFLRLRAAAGRHPPAPATPWGEDRPVPPRGEDRIVRFGKAFSAAGGLPIAGPLESVLHELGEMLRAEGVTVLFAPEDDAGARRTAEALAPFGPFALASCGEVRGGDGTAVTAGFRTAEAGIAETGTVVETSARGATHLPGLISDVHVSLLAASSVFENLEDALASLSADPPRNITLCSGPSRTADIEQVFTRGVFGPGKSIVLLLE